MSKRDWNINNLDPNRDMWLAEVAETTKINVMTLTKWRKEGRLRCYPNHQLTRGQWVIDAFRSGKPPFTKTEIKARHRYRWPERERARQLARDAIRSGKLVPQPCEICSHSENIEAHHDDYFKPLEVRWLCRKHHLWEHEKLKVSGKVKRRRIESIGDSIPDGPSVQS